MWSTRRGPIAHEGPGGKVEKSKYDARVRYLVLLVLVACYPPKFQTITMMNRTPRAIEAVYVYPVGAQSQGASRGRIAPNGTLEVKTKQGNVEVRAVSAEEKVGNQRERKEATQVLELQTHADIVFHDSTQNVAEKPGAIGVVFRILPAPEEKHEDPVPAP